MPNLTNDLEAASGTRLSRAVRPSISRRHPSRPSPALCASTDALIVTQQACPLEHSRAVLRALSWHRAAEACLHSVRRPAIDTTFFSSPHSSDRTSPPHTATRNNPDVCDRHSIANRRLIERLSIASDVCDRRQARDELRGISISSGLANVRSFALIRVQTGQHGIRLSRRPRRREPSDYSSGLRQVTSAWFRKTGGHAGLAKQLSPKRSCRRFQAAAVIAYQLSSSFASFFGPRLLPKAPHGIRAGLSPAPLTVLRPKTTRLVLKMAFFSRLAFNRPIADIPYRCSHHLQLLPGFQRKFAHARPFHAINLDDALEILTDSQSNVKWTILAMWTNR